MNREGLVSLAYDFLSLLIARAGVKMIRRVILFGSIARGEFGDESEIDLFEDVSSGGSDGVASEAPGKAIAKGAAPCLNSFGAVREKRWDIKGISLPLNMTVGDLDRPQGEPLVEDG